MGLDDGDVGLPAPIGEINERCTATIAHFVPRPQCVGSCMLKRTAGLTTPNNAQFQVSNSAESALTRLPEWQDSCAAGPPAQQVLPERPLSAAGSLSLSSLSAPSEDGLDTSSPLGAAADQSLAAAAAVAAAAPPAAPAVPADAQRQQDVSDAEHRPLAVPPGMQRIPDGTAKHEAPADRFAPSPPLQQPQAAAPAQHDTPTTHQAWDAADSPMSPRALPDATAQQNGGADAGAGGQSPAAAGSEAMGALLQPEQLRQPRVQQAHEVALARAEALERNLLSGEHVGLLNELPNSIHSSHLPATGFSTFYTHRKCSHMSHAFAPHPSWRVS